MEKYVRQIVSDLGVNVATKKLVCKRYCEQNGLSLSKLPPTVKKEIHRILNSIIDELVADYTDTSFTPVKCKTECDQVDDITNIDVKKLKNGDLPSSDNEICRSDSISQNLLKNNDSDIDDAKENQGVNCSQNINGLEKYEGSFFRNGSCEKRSPVKLRQVSNSQAFPKLKRHMNRLTDKDVMNSIIDSDNAEVSSEADMSSPCSTPRKKVRTAYKESPLVKRKKQKCFSDSDSDIPNENYNGGDSDSDIPNDNDNGGDGDNELIITSNKQDDNENADSPSRFSKSRIKNKTIYEESPLPLVKRKKQKCFSDSDNDNDNGDDSDDESAFKSNNQDESENGNMSSPCSKPRKKVSEESPLIKRKKQKCFSDSDNDNGGDSDSESITTSNKQDDNKNVDTSSPFSKSKIKNKTVYEESPLVKRKKRKYFSDSENDNGDDSDDESALTSNKQDVNKNGDASSQCSKPRKKVKTVYEESPLVKRKKQKCFSDSDNDSGDDSDNESAIISSKQDEGKNVISDNESNLVDGDNFTHVKFKSLSRRVVKGNISDNDETTYNNGVLRNCSVVLKDCRQTMSCMSKLTSDEKCELMDKNKKEKILPRERKSSCSSLSSLSNNSDIETSHKKEKISSPSLSVSKPSSEKFQPVSKKRKREEKCELMDKNKKEKILPRERKSSCSSLSSLSDNSDIETSHKKEKISSPNLSVSKPSSEKFQPVSKKRKREDKSDNDNVQVKKSESKLLKHLRSICRHIGLILRNTIELKGCDTDDEKAACIKSLLHDKGMKGKPTIQKAEQLNLERELRELGGVHHDSSSPEKRPRKRSRRSDFFSETESNTTSAPPKEISDNFSHMKDIFCADDSSD